MVSCEAGLNLSALTSSSCKTCGGASVAMVTLFGGTAIADLGLIASLIALPEAGELIIGSLMGLNGVLVPQAKSKLQDMINSNCPVCKRLIFGE